MLAQQAADGSWGGGIYTPKWTSTTYTLLAPDRDRNPARPPAGQEGRGAGARAPARRRAGRRIQGSGWPPATAASSAWTWRSPPISESKTPGWTPSSKICWRRKCPMAAGIAAATASPSRTTARCTPRSTCSKACAPGSKRRPSTRCAGAVLAAEEKTREFLLEHRLYKSDKTGKIIHPNFTRLSFPPRWHYDVLRGLAYCARSAAPRDRRCADAIELLLSQREARRLLAPRSTNTPARFSSRWRSWAEKAAGIPCARCGCSAGGNLAETKPRARPGPQPRLP